MGSRWLVTAGVAAGVLVVAACGSSGASNSGNSGGSGSGGGGSSSSAPAASPSTALDAHHMGGALVLTTSKGFTVYWFAPDTSTTSKCNGGCAKFWPPVKGPATAGMNVPAGKLGTIKRSDGTTQATFAGHPLYTYVGDTAPGQAKGNGLNASGGLWHEVTVSGSAAPSPHKSKKSSGGGGGGYGY